MTTPKQKTTWVMTFFPGGIPPPIGPLKTPQKANKNRKKRIREMTTPKKKTTWVMTFFPGGARPLLPKVRFQHVQHPERYTACRWLYQVKSPLIAQCGLGPGMRV